MTSTAGDLDEIAGRYRSGMQRRGDERAGGTGPSQGLEIGEMAHASCRVDAARAGSCNDCGNPLQVRSLARADARGPTKLSPRKSRERAKQPRGSLRSLSKSSSARLSDPTTGSTPALAAAAALV